MIDLILITVGVFATFVLFFFLLTLLANTVMTFAAWLFHWIGS